MTRAIIYGTGSVGSVYGYILHQAGVEVTAICRSSYDAVKSNGISIQSDLYGNVKYLPRAVRSVEEAASLGPFDYIFVCTKAFPGQSRDLQGLVATDTAILLGQNGIGIEEEWAEAYPDNVVISGVVWMPASPVEPGVIKMGSVERLEMGTYPANAPHAAKQSVAELANIWKRGGGKAIVCDDVQEQRWGKVAVNCAFNAMGALSRCDGANLLLSSEMADEMVVSVLREVGTVAAAEGYPALASDEYLEQQMQWPRAGRSTGGKKSSMQVDAEAGRPLEVEAILGNVVKVARKRRVSTPRLDVLYCLTSALDFSMAQPADRWMPLKS